MYHPIIPSHCRKRCACSASFAIPIWWSSWDSPRTARSDSWSTNSSGGATSSIACRNAPPRMCETEIFRNGDGMALETWAESWRWELQHATTNLNIWIWIHMMSIDEIWSNKMDGGEALRPVDSRWSCQRSGVFSLDLYPILWKWTGTWLDELVFAASFQRFNIIAYLCPRFPSHVPCSPLTNHGTIAFHRENSGALPLEASHQCGLRRILWCFRLKFARKIPGTSQYLLIHVDYINSYCHCLER